MRLFGQPVPQLLPSVIDRIGAVVESPKFSPNFSGRQNLTLLARSIGAPTTRVDAAVETVGLTGRDQDRYKSYSLGMKQRLAIAATLLKEPELLILDEPTNGLDPAGIREIRETIRDLGESGVTVLLSSHILAEVQQVCTSATIIGNGRMLASGRVDDLIGTSTSYRVGGGRPRRRTPRADRRRLHGRRAGPARRDRPAGRRHPGARRRGDLADRADARAGRPRERLPPAHRRRPDGRWSVMLRLVRVELTRLRWRRAVMLLLIAAVVIPAIVAAVTVWNSRPVSDADIAAVARDNAGEIAHCEKRPHRYGVDDADGCEAADRRLVRRTRAAQPRGPAPREHRSRCRHHPRGAPAPGRHHLRRPRLEHRLDEQPAALRASARPVWAAKAIVVTRRVARARGSRVLGVLAGAVGGRQLARPPRRARRAARLSPARAGEARPSPPAPRSAATR